MHTQLYNFFDNGLLNDQQHGFRPKKSTSTAVSDMLKNSFKNWNDRLYQTCVFIDFSKAFDCIDHKILISKLELYGLDVKSIEFLSSYFRSRRQCTYVDGKRSEIDKVTYGTAQGSIIGPLIFIIYVNDIFNLIPNRENIIMYADDTLLMSDAKTMNESVSHCQDMLDIIVTWCDVNKLTINVKKTKCMYINSRKEKSNCPLKIKDRNLDAVDQFEYLGMQIDSKLQMNKHVDVMYKKARIKMGILYKIRKFITSETALLIYKVMIRPHLEYGDFLVDSANQLNVEKLERLQEKVLRLVEYQKLRCNRKDILSLKLSLKIENLETRRKLNLLRLMFDQSKCTDNILENSTTLTMSLRSDQNVKMKSDFTRITKIQMSPYYRGVELWNKLPYEIQNISSKMKFKSMVKMHVVD